LKQFADMLVMLAMPTVGTKIRQLSGSVPRRGKLRERERKGPGALKAGQRHLVDRIWFGFDG